MGQTVDSRSPGSHDAEMGARVRDDLTRPVQAVLVPPTPSEDLTWAPKFRSFQRKPVKKFKQPMLVNRHSDDGLPPPSIMDITHPCAVPGPSSYRTFASPTKATQTESVTTLTSLPDASHSSQRPPCVATDTAPPTLPIITHPYAVPGPSSYFTFASPTKTRQIESVTPLTSPPDVSVSSQGNDVVSLVTPLLRHCPSLRILMQCQAMSCRPVTPLWREHRRRTPVPQNRKVKHRVS